MTIMSLLQGHRLRNVKHKGVGIYEKEECGYRITEYKKSKDEFTVVQSLRKDLCINFIIEIVLDKRKNQKKCSR